MGDLIERLKGNGSQWAPLMREAATEIERLQKIIDQAALTIWSDPLSAELLLSKNSHVKM